MAPPSFIKSLRAGCKIGFTLFTFPRLVVAVVAIIFLIYRPFLNSGDRRSLKGPTIRDDKWHPDYVVNTEGCRILDLDPFDRNLLHFFQEVEGNSKINCDPEGLKNLVRSTIDSLYVDEDVAKKLPIGSLECCYRPFWRKPSPISRNGKYSYETDRQNRVNSSCEVFWRRIVIKHQFVHVFCYNTDLNTVVHEDVFTFAVADDNPYVYEDVVEVEEISKPNDSYTEEYEDLEEKIVRRPYSVLILGFDGMSRLNFIRQMPRTLSFFQDRGGITMLGYNKVGLNTFPNLMPALTGRNVSEIESTCLPTNQSVLDYCPFIWKDFKSRGYFTAYAEDAPLVSTFAYRKAGFRRKPVDYYLKPYFLEAQSRLNTTTFNMYTAVYCVGKKENSEMFAGAMKNFLSRMGNAPYFGLFWFNGLSHDFLNFPRTYDERFYNVLKSLEKMGSLESTIIIALSDHGIRWGPFRRTFQGFLEERLPLATIVLPKGFRNLFPQAVANLKENARRLTTPFDIYETLWDVLELGRLPDRTIFDMNVIRTRGMSLFYPIPETRTCGTAGIMNEFCTCNEERPKKLNLTLNEYLGRKVIKHINRILLNARECAQLELINVDAVWEAEPKRLDYAINISSNGVVFIVTLKTYPGNGVFEAKILYSGQKYYIVGSVSRLTMYNNESACVDNEMLKLYCYCLTNKTNFLGHLEHRVLRKKNLPSISFDLEMASLMRKNSTAGSKSAPVEDDKKRKIIEILNRGMRSRQKQT